MAQLEINRHYSHDQYHPDCQLCDKDKRIAELEDRNEVLEKSAEINRSIMDSYGPRFDAYDDEIERLRANVHLAFYEGWDDAKHSHRIDVDMAWDASDAKAALAAVEEKKQ